MGTPSSSSNEFSLPEEVMQVLPSDPFAQLDVARKITSIALSTRVSALVSEASILQSQVTDKDNIISNLQSQLESLDSTLSQTSDRLTIVEQEKDNLVKENTALLNTVAKLRRDVSKLEVFRKTLMQSLQEEEGSMQARLHGNATKDIPTHNIMSVQSPTADDDVAPPTSAFSSTDSVSLERGQSYLEDHEAEAPRPRISPGLLLASQTSTPCLTPPGSPPIIFASVSPSRTSKTASPRRHSVSLSLPSSTHGSFSSLDSGSQSGRTRVDGKEFFRQVRSRLSYEQFGAFLANVKELNSRKRTKEETLRKADEIFGSDNKDLYTIFEGLLTRNVN